MNDFDAIRSMLSVEDSDDLNRRIISYLDVARDGTIMFASPTAERLFGYIPGELVGLSVHLLLPERDGIRARHTDHFRGFWKQPQERAMGTRDMTLVGLRKDNAEVQFTIALFPQVTRGVYWCRAILVPMPKA